MAEQEQRCSLTKHMELARVALSTIQGHMQVKSVPSAKHLIFMISHILWINLLFWPLKYNICLNISNSFPYYLIIAALGGRDSEPDNIQRHSIKGTGNVVWKMHQNAWVQETSTGEIRIWYVQQEARSSCQEGWRFGNENAELDGNVGAVWKHYEIRSTQRSS